MISLQQIEHDYRLASAVMVDRQLVPEFVAVRSSSESPRFQRLVRHTADGIEFLDLPASNIEVLPGVLWGSATRLFTPAFWRAMAWIENAQETHNNYRMGETLAEEVAACLLGGYGMPAELGWAAFDAIKLAGLAKPHAAAALSFEVVLCQPLKLCDGRVARYRFPRTKSRFLASAMTKLSSESPPSTPVALRDWLETFQGIGPKTASWITRNVTGSSAVAILDIHLHRAGILAGVFSKTTNIQQDYVYLESRLIEFAEALGVELAILDVLMWSYMKAMHHVALDQLNPQN